MFRPANGELSRREVAYNAIRDRPTGDLIPYSELPFDQDTLTRLRERVAKTMEREQQRTIVCVPGEGWKIVRGVDQVAQATRKRRQATRRLGRAVQIIESTDRREMSAQERVRTDAELIAATTGYGVLRGLAAKKFGVEDIKQWQEEHPNGH